ncbi:UDP-glucose 4-epimerase family protein [Vibrio maritimus]|uniref:UDP-glucose 4-epimerase family protein n=1 Tax=Vibrio maritimus TaxID=990268 RepID=UPI001F320B75|nr:SDR family oxidoreductase [Vibrio maritimus]
MKILLTGATGFVGGHLLRSIQDEHEVTCLVRGATKLNLDGVHHIYSDFETSSIQELDLSSFDQIIHCAARAHVMNDEVANPLEEYRKTNTDLTLALAQRAAEQGVKRFVFISSIKVNGESTRDVAFGADDLPNPSDDYGVSKAEAEQKLMSLANSSNLEVVVVRPPLVYGPGVKANFVSLYKLAGKGFPLPLGCMDSNRRSLVSIYNLVDFIITCIETPNAANQVFLVSDGEDVSTRRLVEILARAQGKSPWMVPIPLIAFELLGKLTGKAAVIERLTGSLQVDIQKNQHMLNWLPPYTMEQSLQLMLDELKSN